MVVCATPPEVDLQWRASFSKAEEKYFNIIEYAVFSTQYDGALKTMLRNRRGAEEALATQPLSTLVSEVDESLAEELKESKKATAALDDGEEENAGGGAPEDDDGDLPADVQEEIAKATNESPEKGTEINNFVQACWRKIDTHVVLIEEPADATSIMDRLKETAVNKLRLEPQAENTKDKRFVLLIYDLKVAGESSSHPATRLPPLRGNGSHLQAFLRAAIDAGGGSEILGRDMFLIFDGGRAGASGGEGGRQLRSGLMVVAEPRAPPMGP